MTVSHRSSPIRPASCRASRRRCGRRRRRRRGASSRCDRRSIDGPSSSVMSTASDEPPISWLTAFEIALPRRGCRGTTTCAPSRASTVAIDFPIPRAAPVTSADLAVERTLPVDRRSEPPPPGPIRTTCPDTYADFGESRNRSVDSSWSSAPGLDVHQLRRRAAADLLADRPRVSPSSARWRDRLGAASSQSSGGVPSTITRPQARHACGSPGAKNAYAS